VKDDDENDSLIKLITSGWPNTVGGVPLCIRAYYTFADELSVNCGLVFKGHRIVVPSAMRRYFLDRLHAAHTGIIMAVYVELARDYDIYQSPRASTSGLRQF